MRYVEVSLSNEKTSFVRRCVGGMNILRGGKIEYVPHFEVEKFHLMATISSTRGTTGNGMQLISRDFHRLAKSMDVFRNMSFQSSVGMFTEFMLVASMVSFVLCKTLITMFSIETYYSGDAFDNVGFHRDWLRRCPCSGCCRRVW